MTNRQRVGSVVVCVLLLVILSVQTHTSAQESPLSLPHQLTRSFTYARSDPARPAPHLDVALRGRTAADIYTLFIPVARTLPELTIVSDDFSDEESGWVEISLLDTTFEYTENGQYLINARARETVAFSTAGHRVGDFKAQLEMRRLAGAQGAYGLVFGGNWFEEFYFLISPDEKEWLLTRFDRYYFQYDLPLAAGTTDAIRTGDDVNTLRIVKDGHHLILYINSEAVFDGRLRTYTDRRLVGLAAVAFDDNFTVLFDNYELIETPFSLPAFATAGD